MEAVVLTGGASRRMGTDKAKIVVDGEPLAERIARLLAGCGADVTICGREAIPGYAFLEDVEAFAGPLAALARFCPTGEFVFVASCDLPGFDPQIVDVLRGRIGDHEACVPSRDGQLQPLCALYRAAAFSVAKRLVEEGEQRVMAWLGLLDRVTVQDADPAWIANVNTPEQLRATPGGRPPDHPVAES